MVFYSNLQLQEVGDESKLAKSFDRIRSIVRKKKYKKEDSENEKNVRLEKIVREVMTRQKRDENFASNFQETVIGFPKDNIYNRSYQEALNRPITVDFSDPSLFPQGVITTYTQGSMDEKIQKRYSTLINGNSEEKEPEKQPLKEESTTKISFCTETKLLKQISSGSGTEKAGSKGN